MGGEIHTRIPMGALQGALCCNFWRMLPEEKWYFMETETSTGLQAWLKARTVGICMASRPPFRVIFNLRLQNFVFCGAGFFAAKGQLRLSTG